MRWAALLAERLCGIVSRAVLTRLLFGYAKVARFRYRHSAETLANIQEFIARRTEADRRAAQHRLKLIAENDPQAIVRSLRIPVYGLTGLWDPVVPWFWVRRWLKRNCPAMQEYRIAYYADHNVLSTAAELAADQVVSWVKSKRLHWQ
jgi:pimeloyl-ACP methyl ester carboxylesterase